MSRRRLSALLILGLLLFAAANGSHGEDDGFRKFRDKSCKYEVVAKFVEFRDSKVVLLRKDGKTSRVSISALSLADQEFVKKQLASRRESSGKSKHGTAKRSQGRDAAKADRLADSASTTAAAGAATDWRGAKRDGVVPSAGLLDAWDDEGPKLAWRSRGLGQGYSSTTIQDDTLFTMGRNGDGDSELVAVRLPGGEVLWRHVVRESDEPPNCTPVVDGPRVYALGFKGDLVCCEVTSGREVWRKNFQRDFGGKMMSQWGYSESPLIDGDHLICTPGSQAAMLASLDKTSGRTVWSTAIPGNAGPAGVDGAGYSSPVISHAAGVKQYVQLVGRGLISVDARNGKLLWGYNRIANGTANVPTPLVSGDYVFGSTGYRDGGSALLKIERAGRNVTAREVYYLPGNKTQNHHGGMVLLGDHIYMGEGHNNGFPLCIEWKTGRDAWRPGRGPGTGSAAIICADGHLYFRYQNGMMALIEATPAEYRLKGKFQLASRNGNSWPHPIIHDGRLYIRDQDELLSYDVRER